MTYLHSRFCFALVLCAGAGVADNALAATCYVESTASAAGAGTSWLTPTALQTALKMSACTEVWVAAGIYTPTAGSDRTISFEVLPGVGVYGGFAGTESVRDQRDPAAHVTILSGDIDGNDVTSDGIDASAAD